MAQGKIREKTVRDGVVLTLTEGERQHLKQLLGYRTGKDDEELGLDSNVTGHIYEALLAKEERYS